MEKRNTENNVPLNMKNIVFDLRSKELYKDQLDKIPYKDYGDMVMIYRCIIAGEGRTMRTYTITNDILDYIGKSKEELHDLAKNNTKRLYPPTVKGLDDSFFDFLPVQVAKESFADIGFMDNLKNNEEMYFLTNSTQAMASAYFVDETVIGSLSKYFDDDLVVMADVDIATIIPMKKLKESELTPSDLDKILSWNNKQIANKEDVLMTTAKVWNKKEMRLENLTQEYMEKQKKETINSVHGKKKTR